MLNPPYPEPSSTSAGGTVQVLGASADLSHVLIETRAPNSLTPDTPALNSNEFEMYDWSEGQLRLVGVLPDESIAPDGAHLPNSFTGAISLDGSRIYFATGELVGNDRSAPLYVRREDASTSQVGVGEYWGATPDGAHAFFIDPSEELQEFDFDSGQVKGVAPGITGVAGVAGFGDDGSYVYFGTSGGDLYVSHEGDASLIAKNVASSNWNVPSQAAPFSRVSSDGRYLAFTTVNR